MRRDILALVFAAAILGALCLAIIVASSDGHLSAPLDDTFIHLQYARQIGAGHFFAYNTEDGYSSGATSFLYALVLAVPAALGATGDGLLLIAHLLNLTLFAASAALVYGLGRRWGGRAVGRAAGAFFLLNGGILWGYASGMEIGLFASLLLASLTQLAEGSGPRAVLGAAGPSVFGSPAPQTRGPSARFFAALRMTAFSRLKTPAACGPLPTAFFALALMRPEAMLMVGTAAVGLGWRAWRRPGAGRWAMAGVAAGAAVLGLLPLILDWVYTGMVSPNAAQSKLILYRHMEIHPLEVVQLWGQQFTGWVSNVFLRSGDGVFFAGAALCAALGGGRRVVAEVRRGAPGVFTIMAAWLLTNWALAATLVPAQQNRYMIAGYPLVILLMGLGMADLAAALGGHRAVLCGIVTGGLAVTLGGTVTMLAALGENAGDIYRQQITMGHWIARHLPADARIAINDAGAMKYYGEHYMIDLVGLTTNGITGLRRYGDGALLDWLLTLPPDRRPAYFVVYDTWFLQLVHVPGFLTPVYGLHLLHNSIAGGADLPVYQAHWDAIGPAPGPVLPLATDPAEESAGKVVFTGAPGPGPYYLARLVLDRPQDVTLRAEPGPDARLDAIQMVADESGLTLGLPGPAGAPLTGTLRLPAGSYRLYAVGQFGHAGGLTVRLLTPGLRLGLPATAPAPPRRLVDAINIGDPASEAAHSYAADSFAWNVYSEGVLKVASYPAAPDVQYVDSGRRIPGWQRMTVATTPGRALKLVLRYVSTVGQRVRVQADGQDAGLWFYPAAEGWGEAALVLPPALIRHDRTVVRLTLIPDGAGNPMKSFYCWFYQE